MTKKQGFNIYITLFVLFTVLVGLDLFILPDQLITKFIQDVLPVPIDTILSVFSIIGSFELTAIITAIIIFILGIRRGFLMGLMFTIGMIIEVLGKTFINHPNPPKILHRFSLEIFLPSGKFNTGNSYPSGHSYRTTFLLLIINHLISQSSLIPSKYRGLLVKFNYFILLMMLVTRVSLGEHWTTDVIGGALLGFGLATYFVDMVKAQSHDQN